MRRLIYVFIAVMILTAGMAVSSAFAEGHTHAVCGVSGCTDERHAAHADVEWTAWDGSEALQLVEGENNYYLTADVEIGTYIIVARNQTLNLCLNGHTLTMTGSGCAVNSQWRFALCDCSAGETGAITHAEGVRGCAVETYGGSFYMYGGNITGNTDFRGAGVYVGAKTGIADSFYMYGGSISGNSALGTINGITMNQGGYGGGVYLDTGSMYMYGGSISDNTASMYGGGICHGSNATLSISDGCISGNSANYGGGIDVGISKKITIENAVITRNRAVYEGGGVFSAYSSTPATITLKNCTLTDNTAGKYGGAVSCCRLIMTDCVIQDNTATTAGGGAYATESMSIGGNMQVTGNKLDSGAASNLYLSKSNATITCTAPLTGGEGSVGVYVPTKPSAGFPKAFMAGATEADLSAVTCDRMTAYAGIYNGTAYFSTSPIGSHIHEDGTAYNWWPGRTLSLEAGDNYFFINQYSVGTRTITVGEGQTLHLCLNGNSLESELYDGAALISVEGGSLELCSCTEGGALSIYSDSMHIKNSAGGTVELRDVALDVMGTATYALIENKGTMRVSGGSIGVQYAYSSGTDYYAVDNSGAITFADGATVSACAKAVAIINRAEASCILEKGSITGAAKGVVNNGKLEIHADASNALSGNTVAIENSGDALFSGGVITGNTTGVSLNGGTFTLTGSASVHGNSGAADISVTGGSLVFDDTAALLGVSAAKVYLGEDCFVEISGAFRRSLQIEHALQAADKARGNILKRTDGSVAEADIARLSVAEPGDYVIRTNPNDTAFAEMYIPARVYAIAYDLAGGVLPEGVVNPADYTSEDPTFTIENPVKGCHTFAGWTTADITDPMPEAVIYTGSEGPITLIANWEFAGHALSMDAAFADMQAGDVLALAAVRDCEHDGSVDITWSVSDVDILRIDSTAAVGSDGAEAQFTALKPGAAKVVARTAEGSFIASDVIVHSDAKLVLPADLISVCSAAFEGVPAVEIVLPEGLVSIGSRAFADCEGLLIISIPESVTEISEDAFEGCANLTIVCKKDSTAEAFALAQGIPCASR